MYNWKCTTSSSSICWRSISSMVLRYPDKQGRCENSNVQICRCEITWLANWKGSAISSRRAVHDAWDSCLGPQLQQRLWTTGVWLTRRQDQGATPCWASSHMCNQIQLFQLQISRCTDARLRHTITMSSPDSNSAALLCTVHSFTNTSSTTFQTCRQFWNVESGLIFA